MTINEAVIMLSERVRKLQEEIAKTDNLMTKFDSIDGRIDGTIIVIEEMQDSTNINELLASLMLRYEFESNEYNSICKTNNERDKYYYRASKHAIGQAIRFIQDGIIC